MSSENNLHDVMGKLSVDDPDATFNNTSGTTGLDTENGNDGEQKNGRDNGTNGIDDDDQSTASSTSSENTVTFDTDPVRIVVDTSNARGTRGVMLEVICFLLMRRFNDMGIKEYYKTKVDEEGNKIAEYASVRLMLKLALKHGIFLNETYREIKSINDEYNQSIRRGLQRRPDGGILCTAEHLSNLPAPSVVHAEFQFLSVVVESLDETYGQVTVVGIDSGDLLARSDAAYSVIEDNLARQRALEWAENPNAGPLLEYRYE